MHWDIAQRGRDDEALKVLVKLNADDPRAEKIGAAELLEIKQELAEIRAAGSLSWADLFKGNALTSVLCGAGECDWTP